MFHLLLLSFLSSSLQSFNTTYHSYEYNAPPWINYQTALWYAVRNADLPKVEDLLMKGADPSSLYQGRTYLEIAAQNSLQNRFQDMMGLPNPWIPVIEALVQCGADPKQVNHQLLTPYQHYRRYVLWYPNPEIERLLNLEVMPRPHYLTQDLLRLAIIKGDYERVHDLLDQGANVSELTYGNTFLGLAAISAHRSEDREAWIIVLSILRSFGSDPGQLNQEGRTPFDHYIELIHDPDNAIIDHLI